MSRALSIRLRSCIFGTVYMMAVHEMRTRYRDIWIITGILALMLVRNFFLNNTFLGSNYMFLKLDISFMPDSRYIRA